MPAELSSRLEALYAYRSELELAREDARKAGDQKSFEMTEILLRQCDWLIEKAEQDEKAESS